MKTIKVLWVMGLALTLLVACSGKGVYKEDMITVADSSVKAVEEYEAVAFNLRKIDEGIKYLCQTGERVGCKEAKEWYGITRDMFLKYGDALIALLQERDVAKKKALEIEAEQMRAAFYGLYKELKIKATQLGIGGIEK